MGFVQCLALRSQADQPCCWCVVSSWKVRAPLAHSWTCVKPVGEHPLATRRGHHWEARSKKHFFGIPRSKGLSEVLVLGFSVRELKNHEKSQWEGKTCVSTWIVFWMDGLDLFKLFSNGQTSMNNVGPHFFLSFYLFFSSYFFLFDLNNLDNHWSLSLRYLL